jgi:hypothetical protein
MRQLLDISGYLLDDWGRLWDLGKLLVELENLKN